MNFRRMLRSGVVLLLVLLCCVPAYGLELSAASAALMDLDSGRILYAKNASQERLIASTTKIMTALVALETGDLRDVVTVRREDMAEGSSIYLKAGEQLRLETLLYGLLLNSGNDAALAVARHCGGSVEAFVKQMNEKAAELGLEHSSFANPNGLDAEGHYSTAEDMARLAAAAMENEVFARIVSTKSISIEGRSFTNHNKLLWNYPGAVGLKTGYTKAAGRTLVSCGAREGQRLIAVTLNAPDDWKDHQTLLDYGFSTYPARSLCRVGEVLATLPVNGGLGETVELLAEESLSYPLSAEETVEQVLEVTSALDAPVEQGAFAGRIRFFHQDREIGSVNLLCAADVAAVEEEKPGPLARLRIFFGWE